MPSQAINSEDFQCPHTESSNSKTVGGCAQMYNVKMLKITDTLGKLHSFPEKILVTSLSQSDAQSEG